MIVTRAIDHESVPKHKDYTRSEIYLGLNTLVPLKSNPCKTEITTINHLRYGGIPAFIAARNSYQPTVNYLKHLQEVAKSLQ
jgi:hypothetical protein